MKECLKCGFTWKSRVDNPKRCPRCKRLTWNILEEINTLDWIINLYGEELDYIINLLRLSPRNVAVIIKYKCVKCQTAVAKEIGKSRERTRQILFNVARMLRHPSRLKELEKCKRLLGKKIEADEIKKMIGE